MTVYLDRATLQSLVAGTKHSQDYLRAFDQLDATGDQRITNADLDGYSPDDRAAARTLLSAANELQKKGLPDAAFDIVQALSVLNSAGRAHSGALGGELGALSAELKVMTRHSRIRHWMGQTPPAYREALWAASEARELMDDARIDRRIRSEIEARYQYLFAKVGEEINRDNPGYHSAAAIDEAWWQAARLVRDKKVAEQFTEYQLCEINAAYNRLRAQRDAR